MEADGDLSCINKTDKRLYKFFVYQIEKIEPTGNKLRCLPYPAPRSGHRIIVYKGNVFAFGGYTPRNPETNELIQPLTNRHLFKELWKFNIATKTWFNLVPSGIMPTELASHSAIVIENFMLVYGGTGVPFGHSSSNSSHLCNLDTLAWYSVPTTGEKPPPLYGQAIALCNNKIYVVGGTTGFEYNISIHCVNLHTKEWTSLDTVKKQNYMPAPRYRHEIAIADNKIFIFGGGTISESFGFIEIPTFNLLDLMWGKVITTTAADNVFPSPRLCHGSVQVGDDVYICGGHDGTTIFSDIWTINLKQLQWKKLSVEMPLPLYFHSVAMSEEGQAFIFGGVTNTQDEIRTNEIFSIWLKIPSLSDMCWQALSTYIPNMAQMEKRSLFQAGVPLKYLDQCDFESADHKSNDPSLVPNSRSRLLLLVSGFLLLMFVVQLWYKSKNHDIKL